MNPLTTLSSSCGGREAAAPSLPMTGTARKRAALYGFLATLFRRHPSRENLLSLRTQELREALQQAGMLLDKEFFTADVDALAEALAVEFANLFLIPGSLISPHESVQICGGSGLLRGPETARVREYYEQVGFQVDDSIPMEPDHVSIELEFLGHLAAEEANAWEAEDALTALGVLRYEDDFLRRHLGQWIFDFLNRVEANTANGFYRELARLTIALLEELRVALPEMIAQLETGNATP